MTEEPVEIRRKRLIHRSLYTGMKETDLLLGAFARKELPGLVERYGIGIEVGDLGGQRRQIALRAVAHGRSSRRSSSGVFRLAKRSGSGKLQQPAPIEDIHSPIRRPPALIQASS